MEYTTILRVIVRAGMVAAISQPSPSSRGRLLAGYNAPSAAFCSAFGGVGVLGLGLGLGLLLRLWWSGLVRVRVRVRPSAPPLVGWACEFARACARVRPSPLAGPSSLWYPRPRCLLLLERQRLGTWPSSGLRTQLRHAADGGVSMLLDSTALLSRRHVDMAARDGSLPTLPLGRSLMQTPSCCMPMVQARPML